MTRHREAAVKDEHYNLVSGLYHMLQGAWTYSQYVDDSEEAGDEELAALFRDAHQQHVELAERAKTLLKGRLV